jgi:DNA-binding MarR family transcriptional regulator
MPFDSLVTNAGRLRILAALAGSTRQGFVQLRETTRLTDGNLCTHARKLQSAGLIAINKQFRNGRPVTSLELTLAGRDALEQHARSLLAALDRVESADPIEPTAAADANDDWVD